MEISSEVTICFSVQGYNICPLREENFQKGVDLLTDGFVFYNPLGETLRKRFPEVTYAIYHEYYSKLLRALTIQGHAYEVLDKDNRDLVVGITSWVPPGVTL